MIKDYSAPATQQDPVRVFLAVGQPRLRSALWLLLEQTPETDVVGEAAKSNEVLARVNRCSPDILLLDWELSGLEASDLIQKLHNIHPDISIVALSNHQESHRAALAAGINAFIRKGDMPERLLSTIVNCRRKTSQE